MQWHDLMQTDESAEDLALRTELQNMLGMAPVQHPHLEPTSDAIALAKSLHREAMRRRHTAAVAPIRKRPFFMLIAAAIPVILCITAIGTWGVKQKRRADVLAAKTKELETKQNRIDAAREGVRNRESQPPPNPLESEQKPVSPNANPNQTPSNNGELIKPEERPRYLNSRPEQHRVGNRR
ncbi:MAG: hypothetical protein LBH03_02695 [Holophagales bacterium]|jgi:hypothetical protein|nr:hypothetical protein [Holophagales bacterium]